MKIALTGITGMVGSHLIKELSKEDSDGNRHEIKALIRETSVVEHLKPYEDVDYIIGGLEDKESLEKLTNGADVVIHLAHFPGPVKTPNELVEVNVDGSFNLLEAAKKSKIKRFLFLSSSTLFGEILPSVNADNPLNESHPVRPGGMYGAIKAAVETPSEGETPFEESRQDPGTSDHDDRTNQPSLRQGVLALLAIGAVVVVILFATGTVKDRLKIECRTNELYRGMEVLVSYDPPNDQPSPRINDGINRSRVAVDFSDGTDQVEYVNFYKEPKQYLVTHSYRSPGTYTITVAVGGNSDSCEVTILGQAND